MNPTFTEFTVLLAEISDPTTGRICLQVEIGVN